MSAGSGIEWTEATWNPVVGCTRASAGCDHCYAVTMTNRLSTMGQAKYAGLTVVNGQGDRHFNGVVRCVEKDLRIPLGWKKPRRIFVNSMSDLFHRDVPFEFVDRVFAVMALCPQHTFQVLTKRPERMAEYLSPATRPGSVIDAYCDLMRQRIVTPKMANAASAITERIGRQGFVEPWPLPNVWLGTSVENQQAAEERIPHLLKVPAAVRFLSCEPLLGAIHVPALHDGENAKCPFPAFRRDADRAVEEFRARLERPTLHWVIVGGESGPGARPCNLAWVQSLVEQCNAAGVACFVKQLGSRVHVPYDAEDDLREWALSSFDPHVLVPTREGWAKHDSRIDGQPPSNAVFEVRLRGKGGAMEQWPKGLRVREWPQANLQTSSSG